MTTQQPTFEQINMIASANQGDTIKMKNGQECEFVEAKRVKFVGKMNGTLYSIPIAGIKEVIANSNPQEEKEKRMKVLNGLEIGSMFYIKSNKNEALLFKLLENNKTKRTIVGENPINGIKSNIDKAMFYDKI